MTIALFVINTMQKRVKPSKKKSEKSSSLTRSLSARISPLAITQRFLPGSLDLEAIIKKKIQDNPRYTVPKRFNLLVNTNLGISLSQSKLNKLSKQSSEKTIIKKELKSEKANYSLNSQIYANELRMKIKEIQIENEMFQREMNAGGIGNRKVWTVAENFVKKIKKKLT